MNNACENEQPRATPLKPMILTRDKVEKRVFGAGYPSLPTLTVEEWYDQMNAEGHFDRPAPPLTRNESDEPTETEEEDERQRAMRFDEYKDDHRRGWGNTKNKG